MTDIRPRFEVHELEGEVDRVKFNKDESGKLVKVIVKEPAGWMVYFPNGSSIRVRTLAEMQRCGFMEPSPLVDMESGDIVPQQQVDVLKRRSEQVTSSRRSQS